MKREHFVVVSYFEKGKLEYKEFPKKSLALEWIDINRINYITIDHDSREVC